MGFRWSRLAKPGADRHRPDRLRRRVRLHRRRKKDRAIDGAVSGFVALDAVGADLQVEVSGEAVEGVERSGVGEFGGEQRVDAPRKQIIEDAVPGVVGIAEIGWGVSASWMMGVWAGGRLGCGVGVELRARRRTAGKKKLLTAHRLRSGQAPSAKKGPKGSCEEGSGGWLGCAVTSKSEIGAIAELDASVVLRDAGREISHKTGAPSQS